MDGIVAKIERADEHIKEINTGITAFLNSDVYRVSQDSNHETREAIIYIAGPEPPLRFSVMAGEVIHQLRSSLDHLVSQLVIAGGHQPNRRHQFPIRDTREEFEASRKRGDIKGVSASATIEIERRQPYYNKEDIRMHPLWLLRELDDADKHRLLVVVSAAAKPDVLLLGNPDIEPLLGGAKRNVDVIGLSEPHWPVRPSEDGTEVIRVYFGDGYYPEMKVDAQFTIQIAFDEFGALSKQPIVYRLQELRDKLVRIIDRFRPEFS